jgi:hypothetical protein
MQLAASSSLFCAFQLRYSAILLLSARLYEKQSASAEYRENFSGVDA